MIEALQRCAENRTLEIRVEMGRNSFREFGADDTHRSIMSVPFPIYMLNARFSNVQAWADVPASVAGVSKPSHYLIFGSFGLSPVGRAATETLD